MQDKLVCVLFQLPPFIHKNMELLQKIASQTEANVTNVVEFRHESWWDKEVYALMKQEGLVFCSVSSSQLPETLVATADSVYVRFHGKNGDYQYFYPENELDAWAKKIEESDATRVFCYFNNDVNANAVFNCKTLQKILTAE